MKMKKKVIIICFLIIGLCVLFVEVLNISIGYYGYGYDGARMFSLTKQESKNNGVFVKDVKYKVSPLLHVKSIFVEKGFKWDNFMNMHAIKLTKKDDTGNNHPELPYQIIVEYEKYNYDDSVYCIVTPYNKKLKNSHFNDTLFFRVSISPLNNITHTSYYTLKVWDCTLSNKSAQLQM